jgi:hypothetical protein
MQLDPKTVVYLDFFQRYTAIVVGDEKPKAERAIARLSDQIDAVIGLELTPDERCRLIAVLAHALHDLAYVEGW